MNKILRDQIMRLPTEEKIDLVMDVWNSISSDEFPPLTEEQKAELDRRLAEYEAHPEQALPWDEVYARLQARYGK